MSRLDFTGYTAEQEAAICEDMGAGLTLGPHRVTAEDVFAVLEHIDEEVDQLRDWLLALLPDDAPAPI